MIIDVHTHLGRNQHMTARVDDLLRSMDAAGIDQSLVFAGTINGCPTDDMLKEIDLHRDRLFGVVGVELQKFRAQLDKNGRGNPGDEYYPQKLVEQMSNSNVVAAKFYLGYEHFYPDSPEVRWAMAEIAKTGKTVIFHTGDCYRCIQCAKLKYAHPLGIDDVATDFPDMRIVIAHMGYPWQRDAAEVCYKNPNVFADVSGFVYGDFDERSLDHFRRVIGEFTEIVGSEDRLLFGSDWPISNQRSYVDAVAKLGLTEKLQQSIKRVFSR